MTPAFETLNNAFRNSRSPLAEAVTFKLNSVTTADTIYINFFNEDSEMPVGDMQAVRKEPYALCNSADVSGAGHSSYIIRNGVTYYVARVDVDDDGETVLYLSKNQIL